MRNFTYFIISPGHDAGSYVQYPRELDPDAMDIDGLDIDDQDPEDFRGCYIKFGDQRAESLGEYDIREHYLTHNPDINIACVMHSDFVRPKLGTMLKNFIIELDDNARVMRKEWFSFRRDAAWALYEEMCGWDGEDITPNKYRRLTQAIERCLT